MKKVIEELKKVPIIFKILAVIGIIFYLLLIIDFGGMIYYIWAENPFKVYKKNWNINIPIESYNLYNGNDEKSHFIIFSHFSQEKLIENNNFIKIDESNIDKIKNECKEITQNTYFRFADVDYLYEDLKIINNLDQYIINGNYYMLIEKNERFSNDYKYLLLVVDDYKKIVYLVEYYGNNAEKGM